jgi:hypothetical protein
MALMNQHRKTPEVCPVCNEDVPAGSLACPECGADHRSGWSAEETTSGDLGLPNEDFDYNDFVKNEFNTEAKPQGLKTIWWVTAILLLASILLMFFLTSLK